MLRRENSIIAVAEQRVLTLLDLPWRCRLRLARKLTAAREKTGAQARTRPKDDGGWLAVNFPDCLTTEHHAWRIIMPVKVAVKSVKMIDCPAGLEQKRGGGAVLSL